MTRARLFKNGGSQAVRLPREFRFGGAEVLIHRQGRKVILEPLDEWPRSFIAMLGTWDEPIERPPAEPIRSARDPFVTRSKR